MKRSKLKSFKKSTGKQLRHILFFNKVAGLRPSTLLKTGSGTILFCEFCDIFQNTFFPRTPTVAASHVKTNFIQTIIKEVKKYLR